MKKPILAFLFAVSAAPLWAFSAAELSQTLQKPENVQGAFTQQRYLKSLNKPMTTQGQFVLVPKRGLLWHMQKPFDNRLRVRSDGIMQWNGQSWAAANPSKMSGQAQQIRLFLDLLGGNAQGLEKQFALQLSGTQQKWTLRLEPKTALMKQIFKHIDISGDTVVRRIEMHEKQGDRVVMRFNQIQTDKTLEDFAEKAL